MTFARGMVVEEADSAWEKSKTKNPANRWKLLLGAERTPTAGLTMGVVEMAPGQTPSQAGVMRGHHHDPAEVYFVLSGNGRIEIDGEAFDIGPGSTIYIPGGAVHSTSNTGAEVLRFLWMFPTDSLREITYHWRDGSPAGPIVVEGERP